MGSSKYNARGYAVGLQVVQRLVEKRRYLRDRARVEFMYPRLRTSVSEHC